MSAWLKDELQTIAGADDLHISPFREDGVTSGTPTWIWFVAVDDALYVRAYNGKISRWYKAAMQLRKHSMARSSNGWKRSQTSNTQKAIIE